MSVTYRGTNLLLNAADFSVNQTSTVCRQVGAMLQFSVNWQTTASAGLSGTFGVQLTNDPRAGDPGTASSAAWVTVQSGTLAGNTTALAIVVNACLFCQVIWTASAGTGNGTAWLYGVSV